MKFRVEIELGNEAMNSCGDVSDALAKLVADLANDHRPIGPRDAVQVGLRDRNGNTVGSWEVVV